MAEEDLHHSESGSDDDDADVVNTEDMMEDAYGMAIVSLVRDSRDKGPGVAAKHLRILRMVFSMGLLFLCVWTQCYLMKEIKKFVTAKAVHEIREYYEEFEKVMYDHHTVTYGPDKIMGILPFPVQVRGDKAGGYFNASNFDKLSDDVKSTACRIPFSQPTFYYCILIIWSLTVIGELKDTAMLGWRLLVLPTVESMNAATTPNEDGDPGEVTIVGLTMVVKAAIGGLVILPRCVIAIILLWLGCRWLTATANFNDLLLNAVALEFVLLLKDLLYNTLVPAKNKRETSRTKIDISTEENHANFISFFGTFFLGGLVVCWVLFYAKSMQAVLPFYNWDIHDVCTIWVAEKYKV